MTTIEKEQFFALYWRQKVMKETKYPNSPLVNVSTTFIDDSIIYYLELKSLSNISDEDAIELSKMIGVENAFHPIEYVKDMVESTVFNNEFWALPLYLIDYLRLKSYALPYLNYSVEDLVKEGIIKLI